MRGSLYLIEREDVTRRGRRIRIDRDDPPLGTKGIERVTQRHRSFFRQSFRLDSKHPMLGITSSVQVRPARIPHCRHDVPSPPRKLARNVIQAGITGQLMTHDLGIAGLLEARRQFLKLTVQFSLFLNES